MNKPFTHSDVKNLHAGFNPSGMFPNRRMRRSQWTESSRKKVPGRNVDHIQEILFYEKLPMFSVIDPEVKRINCTSNERSEELENDGFRRIRRIIYHYIPVAHGDKQKGFNN